MLLSGRHTRELTELVRKLRLKFAMKDLGPARHILGMKISRNHAKRQLFLSQTDYIGRVLESFNMRSAKSASTPLRINLRQPDIRSGEGRYEVGTVCTGIGLHYVHDGRDAA